MPEVKIDLNNYGVDQTININIPEGMDINDPAIQNGIKEIADSIKAKQIAAEAIPEDTKQQILDQQSLIAAREEVIKDPIQAMIDSVKRQAQSQGVGIGTSASELGEAIVPGGQEFTEENFFAGIQNELSKRLPNDAKGAFSNLFAIAADFGVAKLAMDAETEKKYPAMKRYHPGYSLYQSTKELFKNRAVSGGSMIAAAPAGKEFGNKVYDMINDITRYLKGIPNLDEAMEKDLALRNLYDVRNELLWSGGTVGLSEMWPIMKQTLGRKVLGINEKSDQLFKQAEKANVPANVFTITQSGVVPGLGKVLGVFPFVSTKAKQVQNLQQIAIANEINSTLNNYSPIRLMNQAGMLADEGFRDGIKQFAATKTMLYKRASNIGKEIADPFIPMDRVKKLAADMYENLAANTDVKLDVQRTDSYGYQSTVTKSIDEIFQPVIEKEKSVQEALMDLRFLPDHLSGPQFEKVQQLLNMAHRNVDQFAGSGSSLGIQTDAFSSAMIETLNDWNNFKQLDDPAKRVLVTKFAQAQSLANRFFTENADTFKGRTGNIMVQTDPNIRIPGAERKPGNVLPDQLLDLIMVDAGSSSLTTMLSPMAMKEIRNAVGDTAFKALVNAHLNKKIGNATSYITAKVPFAGKPGLVGRATSFFTGAQPVSPVKTANASIPIINIDQIRSAYGIGNENAEAGIREALGKETYDRIKNVLTVAEQVQQTNFGDVSDFVKRRGTLGGVNSVINIATGAAIASNPFSSAGLLLIARYGATGLADPEFAKGLVTLMNPDAKTILKRQVLQKYGRLILDDDPNVPDEIKENLDPSNPTDVIKYMLFMDIRGNSSYPGSESLDLTSINEKSVQGGGNLMSVRVNKKPDAKSVSEDAGKAIANFSTAPMTNRESGIMAAATKPSNVKKDPFLDVDFTAMRKNSNTKPLNANQRAALASGDLDEAIALGDARRLT